MQTERDPDSPACIDTSSLTNPRELRRADPLARFVASHNAVRPPTLCACWKHGLTACGNRDSFHYRLKSEQVFRVRLETTHGGKSLTAFSTTKKVAENGAARLAPLDLRSDAAASLTHFCGLGS